MTEISININDVTTEYNIYEYKNRLIFAQPSVVVLPDEIGDVMLMCHISLHPMKYCHGTKPVSRLFVFLN